LQPIHEFTRNVRYGTIVDYTDARSSPSPFRTLHADNFLVRHPWDRYAFPVFVAMIWLVILMGFVPQVVRLFHEHAFNYPLAVHVHAAVYVSWLILLTVQTTLIGAGRIALHRRLGRFGAGLTLLLVLMGLAATYVAENLMVGTPRSDPAFISTLLVDVLNFAALATAGAPTTAAVAGRRLSLMIARAQGTKTALTA